MAEALKTIENLKDLINEKKQLKSELYEINKTIKAQEPEEQQKSTLASIFTNVNEIQHDLSFPIELDTYTISNATNSYRTKYKVYNTRFHNKSEDHGWFAFIFGAIAFGAVLMTLILGMMFYYGVPTEGDIITHYIPAIGNEYGILLTLIAYGIIIFPTIALANGINSYRHDSLMRKYDELEEGFIVSKWSDELEINHYNMTPESYNNFIYHLRTFLKQSTDAVKQEIEDESKAITEKRQTTCTGCSNILVNDDVFCPQCGTEKITPSWSNYTVENDEMPSHKIEGDKYAQVKYEGNHLVMHKEELAPKKDEWGTPKQQIKHVDIEQKQQEVEEYLTPAKKIREGIKPYPRTFKKELPLNTTDIAAQVRFMDYKNKMQQKTFLNRSTDKMLFADIFAWYETQSKANPLPHDVESVKIHFTHLWMDDTARCYTLPDYKHFTELFADVKEWFNEILPQCENFDQPDIVATCFLNSNNQVTTTFELANYSSLEEFATALTKWCESTLRRKDGVIELISLYDETDYHLKHYGHPVILMPQLKTWCEDQIRRYKIAESKLPCEHNSIGDTKL